ncbi:hypothetical protein NX059_002736 [Plenodomus lindquistii]|nr:hypothetical protein NX059_002736 [Plenodomus lindquistii]
MLVHNAGIAEVPSGTRTKDDKGRDIIYVTNFIGSWLMTRFLEEKLSKDARVVFTSSLGSYASASILETDRVTDASSSTSLSGRLSGLFKKIIKFVQKGLGLSPSSSPAYTKSKAQQVLLAHLLQQRFSLQPDSHRSAHAFSPGFTSTPIFSTLDMGWRLWIADPGFAFLGASEKWIAVDPAEGAKTGVWLAGCGGEVAGGGFWDWGRRMTSVVDLLKGSMGQDDWKKAARRTWETWERDAGVEWDIEL